MHHGSSSKPDFLKYLFIFVCIGMLITSIAEAGDNYSSHPIEFHTATTSHYNGGILDYDSRELHWAALPGTGGARILFHDGMAYVQFDSRHALQRKRNNGTKLTLGMGVEENDIADLTSAERMAAGEPEWYKSYDAKVYVSVGYSW